MNLYKECKIERRDYSELYYHLQVSFGVTETG